MRLGKTFLELQSWKGRAVESKKEAMNEAALYVIYVTDNKEK